VDSHRHVRVVHLVTILEVIPYGEFARVVEPKEWSERATMHLGQCIASHPEFQEVTFVTLTGEPGIGVVQYAERRHADLIVIPCHGVRGINKRLLGSLTSEVLTHAPCDVLVQRFSK
jgi:nucleotide-binding universal stress UspA family protein